MLLAGDDCGRAGSAPRTRRARASHRRHVVRPLFFPGGDIGRLAVCGTVNDLAMVGARPLWMTRGLHPRGGPAAADAADRIVRVDAARRPRRRGCAIVAGDTKVVERGKVDGLFITTTGVGLVPPGATVGGAGRAAGDAVLVSGPLGDHGIAVSRPAASWPSRTARRVRCGAAERPGRGAVRRRRGLHALRDPTRGGLAASLNELARRAGRHPRCEETAIPVRRRWRAACEMLGLDPLHVANEGKSRRVRPGPEDAERLLAAARSPVRNRGVPHRSGRGEPAGRVLMETGIGGTRIVDMPSGELLPRIC